MLLTSRFSLYAVIAISFVIAHAERAHAQSKPTVVIIDSGSTDLFVESMVRTAAEAELVERGLVIVEGVAVGGDTPARLLACSGDLACTVAALSGISAELVVFLSLRSDDGGTANFKIVARTFDVASGKVLARTMRRCSECKEEVDLAAFSEQVVAELLAATAPETPPVTPPKTPPVVAAPPPPPAPAPVPVSVPAPRLADTSEADRDLSGAFKYVGLGGGVAAIATGTVLILIDGPVIEDGVRQPERRDTLSAGYVTLGAGAALVGLSAWLWSMDAEHEEGLASRAGIVPNSQGASLVWSGGF